MISVFASLLRYTDQLVAWMLAADIGKYLYTYYAVLGAQTPGFHTAPINPEDELFAAISTNTLGHRHGEYLSSPSLPLL